MLSFLYVYSDHSILECYNLFSGVELSMRSFFVIIKGKTIASLWTFSIEIETSSRSCALLEFRRLINSKIFLGLTTMSSRTTLVLENDAWEELSHLPEESIALQRNH